MASSNHNLRDTTNNPYRQHHTESPGPISRDAPEEPDIFPPGAFRKGTPARAMFKDLSTAHSRITSGAARSKPSSTYDLSEIEDQHSIPLQSLQLDARNTVGVENLPLPPPAALVDGHLYKTSHQKRHGRKLAHEQRGGGLLTQHGQEGLESSNSKKPFERDVFQSVADRDNWPSLKSDVMENKNGPTSKQQSYGLHSSKYHSNVAKATAGAILPGIQDSFENSHPSTSGRYPPATLSSYDEVMPLQGLPGTPDVPKGESGLPTSLVPSQAFRRGSNHPTSSYGSSFRDVDTISNIVKLYARSDDELSDPENPPRDVGNKESSFGLRRELSAREVRQRDRKQRAAKLQQSIEPPTRDMLQGPGFVTQRPILSSSQAIGTSPSYGDTNDLLNITQQRSPVVQQRSPYTAPEPAGTPRSDPLADLRSEVDDAYKFSINPFDSDHDPRIIVTEPEDNTDMEIDDDNRDPFALEREISRALRRASNTSCYSNGSFNSSVNQHVENNRRLNNPVNVGELQRLGESFPYGGSESAVVPDNSFWDSAAVASKWVKKSDEAEVRIPVAHHSPPSPRLIPSRFNSSSGRAVTMTEGDPGDWETEVSSEAGLIGGMVNRTGSSLANNSDSGIASSSVREADKYVPGERIVQHPTDSQHMAYRVRNLKETNQPIIFPLHGNHRINGYLTDSNRTAPHGSRLNFNPPPIPDPHRHPFKSSPPEIVDSTAQAPSRDARRVQNTNRYPSSPLTFQTTVSTIPESSNEPAYPSRPAAIAGGSGHNVSWEDISLQPDSQRKTARHSRKEVNSFGLMMDLVRGNHVEGYNSDGSRIAEPEGERQVFLGGPEVKQPAKRFPSSGFAKRPPGGLLRDIKAHAGLKPGEDKSEHRAMKKEGFSRPHSIPDGMETLRSFRSHNSQVFTYRQPTAQPRRDSTLALYHPDLISTQEGLAARDEGRTHLPGQSLLGGTNKDGGSRRQIDGYPRLINYQEPSATGALRNKTQGFGLIVLVLCNLLFPTLALFAWGYLDNLMWWYTNGEVTKFGKDHKRWAKGLLVLWVAILFLGLIAGLVYFFVHTFAK